MPYSKEFIALNRGNSILFLSNNHSKTWIYKHTRGINHAFYGWLRKFHSFFYLLIVISIFSTVFLLTYWGKNVENIVYLSFSNNININNKIQNIVELNPKREVKLNRQLLPDRIRAIRHNLKLSTMKVIIGYFNKHDTSWENQKPIDLNNDEINHNNYSPIQNEGELGKPVIVPFKYRYTLNKYWQINQFNLMASDVISVDRNLTDVRPAKCKEMEYNHSKFASASVVVIFHNEAWSTLIRTIRSVINRSPGNINLEIVLVDDASTRDFLGKPLESYIRTLEVPTRIYRMEKRSGLVASRLMGAKMAKNDILIFLDSHCECTKGWLEPLLDTLSLNKKSVVCPVIDIIKDDTFEYAQGLPYTWGGFTWKLQFRWYNAIGKHPGQDIINANNVYKTPVMAGGLFAVNKQYFSEIGSYDEEMKIWGGENLELSFRIWQCGGSILINPCSHVGHVFRQNSPYTFPGGVLLNLNRNLARVAEVWMDNYKDFIYFISPDIKKYGSITNVTERINIRETLKCQNFDWYLQNVYPSNYFPSDYQIFGKIQHFSSKTCIHAKAGINGLYSKLTLKPCKYKYIDISQRFVYKKNLMIMTDEAMCLDNYPLQFGAKSPQNKYNVVLRLCNFKKQSQKWIYEPKTKLFKNTWTNLCLSVDRIVDINKWREQNNLKMDKCSANEKQQRWLFSNESWIVQN